MSGEYKYLAFISYKREDEAWAKWLQRKLEHYKLPTSVRKANPALPERARPVFKDTTDLAGGVLEKAIKEALSASQYLIVICSPRAAQSPWVCKEVQEFIDSGREEYIIPFIIEGEPNSTVAGKECFPATLKAMSGSRELLGININEMGRDAAAIKVVSRMFDLEFDMLWQRWQRELRARRRWIVGLSLLGMIIAFTVAGIMFYKHLKMQINQSRAVANRATELIEQGDSYLARKLLVEVLPDKNDFIPRPYVAEAEAALRLACKNESMMINREFGGNTSYHIIDGNLLLLANDNKYYGIVDVNTGYTKTITVEHQGEWQPIQFSKGGGYLTVRDGDNILLWDVNENRCVQTFEDSKASHAEIIANAEYIVSSGWNHKKLWNVKTGECIKTLGSVGDFSPNAKYALSVSGTTISILDIANGESIRTLNGHTKEIQFVTYSPDGEHIVSADNNTICLWGCKSKKMKVLTTTTSPIYRVGFTPSGEYVYWITRGNWEFNVWSIKESQLSMNILLDDMNRAFFSDFGEYVLFINSSREAILYSLSSGAQIWTYNKNKIIGADFTRDGNVLLSAQQGNIIINPIKRMPDIQYIQYGDSVSKSEISPKGKYIVATYSNYPMMRLWSTKTDQCLRNFLYSETEIEDIVFGNSEEYFITSNRNTFKLWSATSDKCILDYKNHSYPYEGFSFSNNDKYFVAWTSKEIELWSMKTYRMIASAKKDYKRDESVCISHDGSYILYSSPQFVNVLSTDSMKLVNSFVASNGERIRMAKFNNKGDVIMSSSENFIIWDIDKRDTTFQWELSGMRIDFIVGQQNGALCFANGGRGFDYFVPMLGNTWSRATGYRTDYEIKKATLSDNEDYIITLCSDNKIRIWVADMINAQCVAIYDCKESEVESIIITPDGKRILIKTNDERIRVLDFPTLQDLLDRTREQFKNNPLTWVERLENYLE